MTIRSHPSNDSYRQGWDRIFKPECQCLVQRHIDGICQRCGRDNTASLRAFARSNQPACDCAECNPQGDGFTTPMRMIVCGRCGSKRCPGAESHRNPCKT